MMGDGSSRLRPRWQVIWLLGLAVFFLSPALQTGYWAEDIYQSILPRASIVLDNRTLCDVVMGHVKQTLLMGRFFPLTAALIPTVHYVFHDVWQYKAFILAASILDLFLFYLLVHRLSGRRDYACFAACVTVGLIQYRITIDPSFGFFGQMQLLIAALFFSSLALQLHLEKRGQEWGWLAASVILYLACALLYEVSYVLVLPHVCLISRAYAGTRRRLRASLPFLGVVAFCGFQTVLVRWLHPIDIYWHHTDFDPVAIARDRSSGLGEPTPELLPGRSPQVLPSWRPRGPAALASQRAGRRGCVVCLRAVLPLPANAGCGECGCFQ